MKDPLPPPPALMARPLKRKNCFLPLTNNVVFRNFQFENVSQLLYAFTGKYHLLTYLQEKKI